MKKVIKSKNVTELENKELEKKRKLFLKETTGAEDQQLQVHLTSQAYLASFGDEGADQTPEDQAKCIDTVLASLTGIKPRDEVEGMLAVQMTSTHNLAMKFLSRSMQPDIGGKSIEFNVNLATKLLRTFTSQVETLNRYRNQGQQKVTVEHVTVQAGGQSVVGVVERQSRFHGGGGSEKK
jgi:hypothetical protein